MRSPAPPRELVMPAGLQRGLIAVLAVAASVAVVAAVRTAIRRRSTVPVLVLLGTLLCVVYEPIGDRMVLAYYPERGQITWVSLFGREIPLFVGLMYLAYIPSFFLVSDALRRRQAPMRSWWALWAGTILAIEVIELAVMRIGSAWVYYGPQQTVVGDLPIWTPFTYVAFLFVIAAGVGALSDRLPSRWRWLIIPAVPGLLALAHVAASLPAAVAFYRTDEPALILTGELASMAAATLIALGAVSRRRVCTPTSRSATSPTERRPAATSVATS